jgi:hypothetical protein
MKLNCFQDTHVSQIIIKKRQEKREERREKREREREERREGEEINLILTKKIF